VALHAGSDAESDGGSGMSAGSQGQQGVCMSCAYVHARHAHVCMHVMCVCVCVRACTNACVDVCGCMMSNKARVSACILGMPT